MGVLLLFLLSHLIWGRGGKEKQGESTQFPKPEKSPGLRKSLSFPKAIMRKSPQPLSPCRLLFHWSLSKTWYRWGSILPD